jgi:hypothetical protein
MNKLIDLMNKGGTIFIFLSFLKFLNFFKVGVKVFSHISVSIREFQSNDEILNQQKILI